MTFTKAVQTQLSNPLAQNLHPSWTGAKRNMRNVKNHRNGGVWTDYDHHRFLIALEMYPAGPWKAIAAFVGTKTTRQTISHAQKYRRKIAQKQRQLETTNTRIQSADGSILPSLSQEHPQLIHHQVSQHIWTAPCHQNQPVEPLHPMVPVPNYSYRYIHENAYTHHDNRKIDESIVSLFSQDEPQVQENLYPHPVYIAPPQNNSNSEVQL